MPLPDSGAISLDAMHQEVGGTASTNCSINDSDIRGLISKGSGALMSFSEWYGAASAPTFIGFVTNANYEYDLTTISVTAPTGSNAIIGIAQNNTTSTFSISGSPTYIKPSNETGVLYDYAQGFFKLNPSTTAFGYQARRHCMASAGFSGVSSLAQNVSSSTYSENTVSVTRTTTTSRTFIGLAASHAGSDNASSVNFSGYTAFGRVGGSDNLRGGCGVAYKTGTGVSQTYTHAFGGLINHPTEYAFHELVR
jgi:hypothetical protein